MTENHRLTHKRANGIRQGYWTSANKNELLQRLAEYEDTGLEPDEIREMVSKVIAMGQLVLQDWIPVEERLPEDDNYILLSFTNFTLPAVGRYETDQEGGAFYLGDCDEEDTCIKNDLFVNAWMPLPKPYRPK